nr:copper ion binding protein [Deltaproteobacteria bacterium]
MSASFSIVHNLRTRVRLVVPSLKGAPDACLALVETLLDELGVRSASANDATGSVTLHFDPLRMPAQNLLDRFGAIVADLPRRASWLGDSPSLDQRIPGKTTFRVEGMTCASCAMRVETALGKVPGVSSATVNLATHKATVQGDATFEALSAAVSGAGYDLVDPRPKGQARTFRVEGMTCSSCATRVEAALSGVAGVESATVNLANHKATVKGSAPDAALIAAVEAAGYGLHPVALVERPDDVRVRERSHLKDLLRKLVISAALSLPVLAISMLELAFPGARIVQLVLTTPVVFWAGRQFFVVAYKLARGGSANMDTLIAIGTGAAYAYSVFELATG